MGKNSKNLNQEMAAKNPSKVRDCKSKLDFKYHVPTEYSTVYLEDGHPSFITRVQELYSIGFKGISGNNIPKWAKCCKTLATKACFRTLGHPQAECQDFKAILKLNNITNEREFTSFLKRELPRDKDGNILMPQININHHEAVNQPENHPQNPEPANLVIAEVPAHNNQIQLQEQCQAVAEQNQKLSQEVADLRAEDKKLKVVSVDQTKYKDLDRAYLDLKVSHSKMQERLNRLEAIEEIRSFEIMALKQAVDPERFGASKPQEPTPAFLGKRKQEDPLLSVKESAQERLTGDKLIWKKKPDELKRLPDSKGTQLIAQITQGSRLQAK